MPAKRDDPGELSLGLKVETPGLSAQNPISVTSLTAALRELIETGIGDVWVTGEISNFRAPGSGHLYFTLKDEAATLAAVMFRPEARRIGFALEDGMALLARGAMTVYEARGQYQLVVSEVRPRGQGGLQQRFEELKRKLQAEGLFALERKRPLPVFPEVIGVVTSLQGAVLHDILQVLQRRAPGIRIRIRDVRVQGVGAAQEIAAAIATFSAEENIDLLVVARGGGSLEDLWAFNEEPVARALAACRMPTISAVGHETDFTIADFVADLRAPTPSAAAELLTRDWAEWHDTLAGLRLSLDRTVRHDLASRRRHLAALASSYALREPRRVVRQWVQRLDDLRESLISSAHDVIQQRRQELALLKARLTPHHPARKLVQHRAHLVHLVARLRTLGPQATLDRGYALVLDEKGRPISKAKKTVPNQPVQIVLSKGAVDAGITGIHPDKTLLDALHPTAPAPKKEKKAASSRRKPSS
ncbi:MAG: exodeoxyribonuclease VII large subunit [Methylacidiphilales bacterium]|nr:exodeoxyribonuclease VII large subunit [Candidatus Methylacidiphilales bacterium]